MEQVFVIAVKSFINGIAGSVTKKQKLLLPKQVAAEFISMGLVVYAEESKVQVAPKKLEESNQSPKLATDGQVVQSALLPVVTASPKVNLPKPKKGRPAKTGK